jgi:hypothetical protein
MNSLYSNFLIRIVFILFVYFTKLSNYEKVIVILLSNFVDCEMTKSILQQKDESCKSYEYRVYNEYVLIYSYTLCLSLVGTDLNRNALGFAILYRFIGVIFYQLTKNPRVFILFPDVFNEYLITDYLFNLNRWQYLGILGLKAGYEYLRRK